MGTALTIRDLVGERAIFQREQAVGLSTTAYLLAKTAVFCGFAIVQSAIVTAIVVIGKSAPTRGAVLLGHSTTSASVELFSPSPRRASPPPCWVWRFPRWCAPASRSCRCSW